MCPTSLISRPALADAIAKAVAERHHTAAGQGHGAAEHEVGVQTGRGELHRAVVGDRAHQRGLAVGRADKLTAGGNRHAVEHGGFLNGAAARRRDDSAPHRRQRAAEDHCATDQSHRRAVLRLDRAAGVGEAAAVCAR